MKNRKKIELAKICLRIKKHYGFPCDIEWAYEKDKFYIVQSRPITTLAPADFSQPESESGEVWINNFSMDRGSFQIIYPAFDFGFQEGQRVLLGEGAEPIMTKDFGYFHHGLDMKGGYFIEDEVKQFVDVIMNIIQTDPAKIEELDAETYKLNDDYFAYANECLDIDLDKLSNNNLSKIHHKLTMMQENAHLNSLSTTWFVDSYGETFSKWLIEETKKAVQRVDSEANFAEVFSEMTTLSKNSLGIDEEIESLQILKRISADDRAKEIFLNLSDYSQIPTELPGEIRILIQVHFSKWRWIPFGYIGPAYDIDYYLTVWSGLLREKIDIEKEIAQKINRPESVEVKRNKLVAKFNFSAELQRLYDIAANIAYLKGYRKDCSYHGFYAIDKMFAEMAKRFDRDKMDFYYFSYREIGQILSGTEIDEAELTRRKDCSVISFDGEKTEILSGDAARDFVAAKNIKEEIVIIEDGVLSGTVAKSGKATGHVKIINYPEEMGKMEEGDIIVAHSTFPSLVPAMKKAAAIVTEDGGITCHAAIVARELGTPCITGIKTATKVLQDGDLVEVDANKAQVKIIERAK